MQSSRSYWCSLVVICYLSIRSNGLGDKAISEPVLNGGQRRSGDLLCCPQHCLPILQFGCAASSTPYRDAGGQNTLWAGGLSIFPRKYCICPTVPSEQCLETRRSEPIWISFLQISFTRATCAIHLLFVMLPLMMDCFPSQQWSTLK